MVSARHDLRMSTTSSILGHARSSKSPASALQLQDVLSISSIEWTPEGPLFRWLSRCG